MKMKKYIITDDARINTSIEALHSTLVNALDYLRAAHPQGDWQLTGEVIASARGKRFALSCIHEDGSRRNLGSIIETEAE
jgi:hypothetical protein